jgi:hypothetical protein
MGTKRTARSSIVLAALLFTAAGASAQENQVIRPGMTEDEVKAAFGEPQGMRTYGRYTYFFYENGCEQECGFPDIVFFEEGRVVDAVLRAPWREYAGESSSPKGVIPRPTPGGERIRVPAAVEGVEVRPTRVPTPVEQKADTARADTSRVRG